MLDAPLPTAEERVMTKTLTTLALVAAAALAGCDQSDHTINGNAPFDPKANAESAAPITLPPSIVASHAYRCKDNSLVSIDWLSDGKANSARVTPQGGATVALAQAEAGAAYTAEGASLTGDPQAKSITFNSKACNR